MASKLGKASRSLRGFNKIRRNLKEYGGNVGHVLNEIALATGHRVASSATASLETGAGRAPDPQTHELARSVKVVQEKNVVGVGTAVKHGFFQEFGTVEHKASPWLYPALRGEKKFHDDQLKTLHNRAMQGIDSEPE